MMSIFISSFQRFVYPPVSKRSMIFREKFRISVVIVAWTSISRLPADLTANLMHDFRGSVKSLMLPNPLPSCWYVSKTVLL